MFYVVNQKPSGREIERFRTDFHYEDSVKKIDAARCQKCNSYIGMREPVPPFRVRIETWGIGFGDFAFCSCGFNHRAQLETRRNN